VVGLLPQLRKHVAKLRPSAQRVGLTGTFIELSVVESLKRLQVDYVDVLGLHEPDVGDVQRDDVLQALDNVVGKGYARTISVAGDLSVALTAMALSDRISIIQIGNSPFAPNIALAKHELPADRSVGFITHSVYGKDGPLDALTAMIVRDAGRRSLMKSVGYRDAPRKAAASFLLDFALSSNPDGVTLLSMYEPRHFNFNIGRLMASPSPEVVIGLASGLMFPQTCLGRWDENLVS
jgi:aryl-alcohol dehydrogenase-like predicted oxidoreductase